MQFDRAPDGTLTPLPAPCVDTGMGLERLAAVLQHVHSNYEIDLFAHLIAEAGRLTATADLSNKSLRVIADHIRACSFLIVDGVLPSNEGRGYVLRRIIRRALRHGWMLGVRGDFFWKMVAPLVEEMGEAYPEIAAKRAFVEQALKVEEERFGETLEHGMRLFDDIASKSGKIIPGADAFRLYDTYGFPVDLTADIARERDMTVDMEGFERAMGEQRARARAASNFSTKAQLPAEVASALQPTIFTGYDALDLADAKVVAIVRDGKSVDQLADGEEGFLLLDRTPFYAESGGQVGDTGMIRNPSGALAVEDTQKVGGAFFAHFGTWQGSAPLLKGAVVGAAVDGAQRQATVLNHSATHLLHAALRTVLGEHVTQKGSLVAPERLRFDFSHFKPVTGEELAEIERMVNDEVRRNAAAEVHHMGYDDAIEFGAMALFGEKYGAEVRVLKMGDFSTELCGGTHVGRTGDIGLFKIVSESGVAAGIRRIEAVTGAGAMARVADEERILSEVSGLLAATGDDVVEKLRQLFDKQKKLEKEVESFKAKAASSASADLVDTATDIAGIKVVAARLEGLDAKSLRDSLDVLKQKLGDCAVILAGAADGRVSLVAGVGGAALGRVKAGDLVAEVASKIDGKGGGRPDMAQGGGVDSPALPGILAGIPAWVEGKLR
jgi:alanyl-tRNA synthetase